jgi:hypothetical protein
MPHSVKQNEFASHVIARAQLALYDRIMSDRILANDAEAEDCATCESYRELGVQVFHWIIKADQDYRRELYRDPATHSEAVERELEALMRRWHARSQAMLTWADRQIARGFQLAHLDDFRHCAEEAAAIVKSFDDTSGTHVMLPPLILLRDQALIDHQNGETSEFV